jgi:predicted NUDIX family NTP pyrophosphohydrolase
MPKTAAGLLMYRRRPAGLEILLVHPGGPYYANKDDGAWGIPKGHAEEGEELLAAARREFTEETGLASAGPFIELQPVRLKSGKVVHAWAFEGDCDPAAIHSNTFTMEWPPGSGQQAEFPEIDKAAWFPLDEARTKISSGQLGLLEELGRPVTVNRLVLPPSEQHTT